MIIIYYNWNVCYLSRMIVKVSLKLKVEAHFSSSLLFKNCRINKVRSSLIPICVRPIAFYPAACWKHRAECIFVCCFITYSCFIDGDLKAPTSIVCLWRREVGISGGRQHFHNVSSSVVRNIGQPTIYYVSQTLQLNKIQKRYHSICDVKKKRPKEIVGRGRK